MVVLLSENYSDSVGEPQQMPFSPPPSQPSQQPHAGGGPRFDASGPVVHQPFNQPSFEGLELGGTNGWGAQTQGWFTKHKIYLVGAGVGIIVLGALFFALPQNLPFSFQQDNGTIGNDSSANLNANSMPAIDETTPQINVRLAPDGSVVESSPQTSSLREENSLIHQEANAGDGITHLARKAISERLAQTGASLTHEQRIYAEDYAQKAIGDYPLNPGDKLSFPKDLLDKSIGLSEELSDSQLQNLTQYAQRVTWSS